MNTCKPKESSMMQIEWHCLTLPYQQLRLHLPKAKERLILSICQYGQLVPIIVIPASEQRWTVIDGYLRLAALKELGYDTVRATAWELDAPTALIHLYNHHKSRPWEAIEEGALLQELVTQHHYSQAQLAKCLGKSDTFVCHRLQLISLLPSFVKEAIYRGNLSTWSASRVLIPFARANEHHARQFMDYLTLNHHSTRELQDFYEHYMRSSLPIRQQMIEQPALFFKSRRSFKPPATSLPEQQWDQTLTRITDLLKSLKPLLQGIFYPRQTQQERCAYESKLHGVQAVLDDLTLSIKEITYDQTTGGTNNTTIKTSGEK
jgi:ParB family transcriptional regulator, chromosome partitioning protein